MIVAILGAFLTRMAAVARAFFNTRRRAYDFISAAVHRRRGTLSGLGPSPNVACGSSTDIPGCSRHVCFTPVSGLLSAGPSRRLWAISGQQHSQNDNLRR